MTFYEVTFGETACLPRVGTVEEKTTAADGAFTLTGVQAANPRQGAFIVAQGGGLALGWATWEMQVDERFDIVLSEPKELGGDVVDEAGRPVADAEVSIAAAMMGKGHDLRTLELPGLLTTTTDKNGRFLFANMPREATFEFLVRKPGRATLSTIMQATPGTLSPSLSFARSASAGSRYQFSPGQTGIRLILPPEARIEGVVVEKMSGKPVGGTKVIARPSPGQDGFLSFESVSTAADGTFRIGGLAADHWFVQVETTGERMGEWAAQAVQLSLKSGETKGGIRLELTKGGVIEVLVADSAAKPVGNTNVDVRHTHREGFFGGTTNENGLARIRVPAGQYRISGLDKWGHVSDVNNEPITIEEGETKRIRCVLDPVSTVVGIVRDEGGNPLAGVKVEVTPVGREAVLTDSDGRFAVGWYAGLGGPQATRFILVARDPARNLAEIMEIDQRTGTLDLTLKGGVIFTGTVLNQEGRPLAGAHIQVSVRALSRGVPLGVIGQAITAEDGKFEVTAIPAGRRYVITATAPGYGPSSMSIDALSKKGSRQDVGQLKLALANLSISGIVVDIHNKPVAGAFIFTAGGDLRTRSDVRTDTDGKFVITGIKPGSILVIASTRGAEPMHGSVWAEGGATNVRIIVSR